MLQIVPLIKADPVLFNYFIMNIDVVTERLVLFQQK